MKHDWWFKFEHLKWLTDEQLSRCSLETQGFWIRCICLMRKSGTAVLEGSGPELLRMLSVSGAELKRCTSELMATGAADVTVRHALVTQKSAIFRIVSRKIQRELKTKEQNRLRKQRERRHAKVTDPSRDRVKSNKKEVREEERREASASPPAPETPEEPNVDQRKSHPAIVAVREVRQAYPPKLLWDDIIGVIGMEIDLPRMRKCFSTWVGRNYKPDNFDGWLMDWYVNKHIPPQSGKNGNGTNRNNQPNRQTSTDRLRDTAAIYDKYPTEAELRGES